MSATVLVGDCLDVLRALAAESFDAVVTDPPYGLEFMGKAWDTFRVDDPGTARNRGDRAGAQGEAGQANGGHPARGRTAVAFGAGVHPTTSRCSGCGKRDQFRNQHSCTADAEWRKEVIHPNTAPPSSLAYGEWCRRWAFEVYRVLKPGAHLVSFGGGRTVHRLTSAIEDAGFEVRGDSGAWLYWQGFPKSADVERLVAMHECHRDGRHFMRQESLDDVMEQGKGRDGDHVCDATEDSLQWAGWGTATKPTFEPWVVARKPLSGSVAENVLRFRTGALHIDAARIPYGDPAWPGPPTDADTINGKVQPNTRGSRRPDSGSGCDYGPRRYDGTDPAHPLGWFPPNIYACPKACRSEREAGCDGLPVQSGAQAVERRPGSKGLRSPRAGAGRTAVQVRNGHPTVKPLAIIRWLVRLVTPPGGVVLDPFLGSGTTAVAAILEGFAAVGIERSPEYSRIAEARIAWAEREREILTAQADLFRPVNTSPPRPVQLALLDESGGP